MRKIDLSAFLAQRAGAHLAHGAPALRRPTRQQRLHSRPTARKANNVPRRRAY